MCRSNDIQGWKPVQPQNTDAEISAHSEPSDDAPILSTVDHTADNVGRRIIEQKLRQKIYVTSFPGDAGAVLPDEEARKYGFSAYTHEDNFYAPFLSELDWGVAKWAKLRGPSSAAITELLELPGVSSYILYCKFMLRLDVVCRETRIILQKCYKSQ